MYDQRIAEPAPERAGATAWRPDVVPFDADAPDPAQDRYVAVDRIDEDVATIVVARWPSVDQATGRLTFGAGRERLVVTADAETLRRRVDVDRRVLRQLRRPVRVGDVFWVRGFDNDPSAWGRVIDVTRAGRFAAKAALLATAAGAPSQDASAAFGIETAEPVDLEPRPAPFADDAEALPPPGPVAFPAV